LIVLVFLLPLSRAIAENMVGEMATEVTLQDQYEKTVSLRQYGGHIVVLLASDKEGKAQNAAWIKAISGKYAGQVAVQGMADVSNVPFFLKNKIRNDLKKDEGSIILDWNGEVFRSYGFAKGRSNIVLIDSRGVIRHRSSGAAAPGAVQELFRKIEALN
jgi:predicted transcriptional regulator